MPCENAVFTSKKIELWHDLNKNEWDQAAFFYKDQAINKLGLFTG